MKNIADLIESAYFFLAFLSVLWVLALPIYWIVVPNVKSDRESVRKKYVWYQSQISMSNRLKKIAFVLMNAHSLCPLKGIALATSVIISFIVIF